MGTKYHKAIFTGGTGYLCSNLINNKSFRELLSEILILGRHPKEERIKNSENISFKKIDLTDREPDLPLVRNTDILFHSAHLRNIDADMNFLEKFKNKKIVFFSSSAVYGESIKDKLLKPSDHCDPVSDYGYYKLAVEEYLKENFDSYLILRISNPIAGENSNRNIYQIFKNSIDKNETIYINSEEPGQIIRDFIYMPDFIKQVTKLIKNDKTGVFNISSGEGRTLESLLEELCKEAGKDIKDLNIVYKGFKDGDIRRSVLEPS